MADRFKRAEAAPAPRTIDELVAAAVLGGETLQHHGGGPRGLGAAGVAVTLAFVVRLAERFPKGSPERRALAEAAIPLRAQLDL